MDYSLRTICNIMTYVSGGDDRPFIEDHCLFQEVMMDHSLRTIGCFRR